MTATDKKLLHMTRCVNNRMLLMIAVTLTISLGILSSCDSDDIGGNLYTSVDPTMGQYLKSHPEEYSEFTKILDTTKVIGLLNTIGDYTCFAPDNQAMKAYYQLKGK